jgi:hypothetical protein
VFHVLREVAPGNGNEICGVRGGGVAFRFGEGGTPPFFVSVASKGLKYCVSPLESILVRWLASVDFKRFSGPDGVTNG